METPSEFLRKRSHDGGGCGGSGGGDGLFVVVVVAAVTATAASVVVAEMLLLVLLEVLERVSVEHAVRRGSGSCARGGFHWAPDQRLRDDH